MFSLENLEKHKTVKTSHITILNEIVLIEYTVSLLSLDMSWTFFVIILQNMIIRVIQYCLML